MNVKAPYQELPPLRTEELEALRMSIEREGIREPIRLCATTGAILDGHHRKKITDELGIDCPSVEVNHMASDAERSAYAIRVNKQERRNLSVEQREELALRERELAWQLNQEKNTDEQIGRMIGIDRSTVTKWLSEPNVNDHNGRNDHRIKLTPDEKENIFERIEAGEIQEQVGVDHGITQQHAGRVHRTIKTKREKEEIRQGLVEESKKAEPTTYTPEIITGDALDLLCRLDSESIDLVCVDPPYNVGKASWDDLGTGKEYALWAGPWLEECRRVLRPTGSLYLFGVNRMLSHLQHLLDSLGMIYRNWIAWDTIQGAGGGLWVNRYESILYYSKTTDTLEDPESVRLERHEANVREYKGVEYRFKNPSNVWRFPCVDSASEERTGHPTQKPVALLERIIQASSPAGGLVLDPFFGSGTTLVAAMEHRRRSIGFEVNPAFVAMAEQRISLKAAEL